MKKKNTLRNVTAMTVFFLILWQVRAFLPNGENVLTPYKIAKAVVCWPIQMAVECCVGDRTRIVRISKPGSKGEKRHIVQGKKTRAARIDVKPDVEFRINSDCGNRWRQGTPPSEMVKLVTTAESFHLIVGEDESINITKATYQNVEVGDVIISDGDEEGSYTPTKEAWGWLESDNKAVQKAWDAYMKAYVKALNDEDALDCEQYHANNSRRYD